MSQQPKTPQTVDSQNNQARNTALLLPVFTEPALNEPASGELACGLIERNSSGDQTALALPSELPLPRLITDAGDKASWRFINFFTAEIENDNTRAAYYRAVLQFDTWCQKQGIGLHQLQPFVVATYAKELKATRHPQTVKQHLAALRMLLDSMVIGQVLPHNPVASVKGPRYSMKKGKTPVLQADETRLLLNSIDTSHVVGMRDRALIAVMVYSFARVSAVIHMRVEDFYPTGRKWMIRLHEKGGKFHQVLAHHNAQEYLHLYIEAAGIAPDSKGPLFRTTQGASRILTTNAMTRRDVHRMIKRRAADAGVSAQIGCHTFRATGITTYLRNGGTLEYAQKLACHESARTTGLYDRREEEVSLDEIERIII
jgi:site-specific recombinase XerD